MPRVWCDENAPSAREHGDVSHRCETSDEHPAQGCAMDQAWHHMGTLPQARRTLLNPCRPVCTVPRWSHPLPLVASLGAGGQSFWRSGQSYWQSTRAHGVFIAVGKVCASERKTRGVERI